MNCGEQNQWNVIAFQAMSKIIFRWETPLNGVLKNLSWPVIPSGGKVEYHPIRTKDQARLNQIVQKILSDILMGYAPYAGGSWKGDLLVADVDEAQENDASEVHVKRNIFLCRKRVNFTLPCKGVRKRF